MKTPLLADDRETTPAELEDQAWVWLRLFASGKATNDDGDRFRHWVLAGPEHRAAYSRVKKAWDAMTPQAGKWLQTKPMIAALHRDRPRQPVFGRRAFLGAVMGAAAAAGVAIAYPPLGLWPAPSVWGADYRTATGEQRVITLADSVEITLNTQTSIRRRIENGETIGMELMAGETAIDLARAGDPFTVAAGVGRSSAESGQFEVRNLNDRVCVTCIKGAVRVEHLAGTRALRPREQAVYDTNTISGIAAIDPVQAMAWRNGVLIFNEIRLADAIEEINRYRSGRVILMNDAARDKRVSGSFPIASLDKALWQMQQFLHLETRSLVGGVVILS